MKKTGKHIIILLLALLLTAGFSLQSQAAVKLGKTKLTLRTGNAYVLPLTGTKKAVEWTSSKPRVVSIVSSTNKQVVLKAKKAGSSKITATIGKKTYTCKVTVRGNTPMPRKLTLIVGDKFTFTQEAKAVWTLSKTAFGKLVTKNKGKTAVFTAKRPGALRVTATIGETDAVCHIIILTKDGSKTATAVTDPDKGTDDQSGKGTGTDNNKETEPDSETNKQNQDKTGDQTKTGDDKSGNDGKTSSGDGTIEDPDKEIATNMKQVTFVKVGMVSMAALENTEEAVTWKSADKAVATVDDTGKIKATGAGETTIYTKLNGKKYSIKAIVRPCTLVRKKVTIAQSKKITNKDETISLHLWWSDTGEEVTGLEWVSANKKIATVSKDTADKDTWKIHAKKNGKTDITCKYLGGTFTINLTVELDQ